MYENSLRSLPRGLFSGLENLEEVDLGFNPLIEIPTQELFRIKRAILGSRRRMAVESREFFVMQNLNHLSLSNGNIQSVAEDAFQGLSSLQSLNLAASRLNELPPRVFRNLHNLETIDIYQNRLQTLAENIFSGLSNLKELSLRANRLSVLPDGVFRGLVALEELYLDMNQLTDVAPVLLANLPSLRLLNLRHNRLTTLPAPPLGSAAGPLLEPRAAVRVRSRAARGRAAAPVRGRRRLPPGAAHVVLGGRRASRQPLNHTRHRALLKDEYTFAK
ncbi:Toll-like protein [Gryllus bimaculatus]|nr:Toll-like protein [Gryllus bimaculatus]